MRRCVPLSVVLLLAACARPGLIAEPETGRRSAPPAPEVSSVAPPTPRCVRGIQLTVGEPSAAMGLRATTITVHNCGTEAYAVDGYPVLELLDKNQEQLAVRVDHGITEVEQWNVPARPVTVEPGESAHALLLWRNLTTDKAETAEYHYRKISENTTEREREREREKGDYLSPREEGR